MPYSILIYIFFILFIVPNLLLISNKRKKKRYHKQALLEVREYLREKEKINHDLKLYVHSSEMKAEEFLMMRSRIINRRTKLTNQFNLNGVYVLHNSTKDKYYVGQGKHVINRVNNHLTGKGNGDVYADFKYGDVFTVKMIPLINSGYENLNDLERHTIRFYDAYTNGYNKTRGNK